MSDLNLDEYDIDAPSVEPESVRHEEQAEPTQIEQDIGVPDMGADTSAAAPVRRSVPKLDATRLLNKRRGYPYLLSKLKNIKYKGRGHERQYLERYMVTYQLWANRLWPKAKLGDFVQLARNNSRDPQIRRYCRDLIEEEKEERVFGKRSERGSDRNSAQNDPNSEELSTSASTSIQNDISSEELAGSAHVSVQNGANREELAESASVNTQSGSPDSNVQAQNSIHQNTHDEVLHRETDTHTRSEEPTNEPSGTHNGVPDDEFDFSQFDQGANADELEAARELYGDLDF